MIPLKTRHRWFLRAGLLAAITVLLTAGTCYFLPQQVLTVESGPVKADVIVVLGGDSRERPERAAELFKAGDAALIICTGAGDAVTSQASLTNAGVPLSAIRLEPCARTTQENARLSIPILRALGARRVIIVTSWYHSRRALACFEHYAPDLRFYSRPSYYGYPKTEWNHDGIGGYIQAEYRKIFGYWVCYGVCPL